MKTGKLGVFIAAVLVIGLLVAPCAAASGTLNPDTEASLGDNLLYDADFNYGKAANWWIRHDWNGGAWELLPDCGVDGTGGLCANGGGTGRPEENAGVYYSDTMGEINYLILEAGETYQFEADVFRPQGVASRVYLDVNEGALGNVSAVASGEWEHISMRFVAPSTAVALRIVANALPDGQHVYADNFGLRLVGGTPTPGAPAAPQSGLEQPQAEPSIRPYVAEQQSQPEPTEPEEQQEKPANELSPWVMVVCFVTGAGAVVGVSLALAALRRKKQDAMASVKEDDE